MTRHLLGLVLTIAATGQNYDPALAALETAYEALRAPDYETAIAAFRRASELAPERASIRKDLAYALLKVGENAGARDQFGEAMRLDPDDQQAALEYAFLCHETKQPMLARRVFDRLRRSGNATAAEAFENIDGPLREGIERWTQALQQSPDNFSAHEELARLAERRDEWELAAQHYERAWRLRPARRDLLLDLGRVWREIGETERANAALLAASRGSQARVAEQARALLPDRYPYVYEFQNALELDPSNDELRRELAYLHVAMGDPQAAGREFARLPAGAAVRLASGEEPAPDPKAMAERSLEKGYLKDAVRYLHAAHEDDPADFDVIFQLATTYNILQDDREAIRWFDLAREAPDARIATEATRAYDNLAPGLRLLRTTVWAFPMISSRWMNTFAYAQAKTELRLPGMPLRPYASLRVIGDTRGRADPVAGLGPQYLSERSAIFALGLATPAWRGASAWFEAGEAVRYRDGPGGRAAPDYRGGLSYANAITRTRGLFAETTDDLVYLSRFNKDTLLYSQNRTGWSLNDAVQIYWNWNANVDLKREYWANTVETGPGLRFRIDPVTFTVSAVRGVYLINGGNPFRPNYYDLRVGMWYAFTR